MTSNLRVRTEKFRAINEADIIIDGITLVAGENGCGKSTISKLLYFLFKTVSNYDQVIKQKLMIELRDVLRFFDIFQQEIVYRNDNKLREEYRREILDLRKGLYNSGYLLEELEKWVVLIEKVESLYSSYFTENSELNKAVVLRKDRLDRIIKEIQKNETSVDNEVSPFTSIKDWLTERFNDAREKIELRPTSIFIEELNKVFSDDKIPDKFDVLEYNDIIVSLERSNLSIPFSIDKAIYIDTPMMLSIEDSYNEYWDDLNNLLREDKKDTRNVITEIISTQVIQGDVELNEGVFLAGDFKFKRADGAIFNLIDVATGIKAFSILQLLLKNGHLNEKTLLIIDEPESHLHPQWIIEYARVIVLLNKHVGVKFFLASHNPDMVSAIRHISEKQGILEDVNFYIAQKNNESFNYNYKFLNKEIDPIFESFNIAFSRINQYVSE
ncbi:MAG: AAA family ATPase [Flectobacillus sp.]|uniref:AAA family ATPase n=1 Tax=Flectobacillus sp. TaxID=50419 RepID=UPI003B9C5BB0